MTNNGLQFFIPALVPAYRILSAKFYNLNRKQKSTSASRVERYHPQFALGDSGKQTKPHQ
jgi:hypothetical protein